MPSSRIRFAPPARAIRHGFRLSTTFTTSRSFVRNTASIANRMKNMWIDPVGSDSSRPSPAARPVAAEQALRVLVLAGPRDRHAVEEEASVGGQDPRHLYTHC